MNANNLHSLAKTVQFRLPSMNNDASMNLTRNKRCTTTMIVSAKQQTWTLNWCKVNKRTSTRLTLTAGDMLRLLSDMKNILGRSRHVAHRYAAFAAFPYATLLERVIMRFCKSFRWKKDGPHTADRYDGRRCLVTTQRYMKLWLGYNIIQHARVRGNKCCLFPSSIQCTWL